MGISSLQISQLRHGIHLHRPIEAHVVRARADARGQGTGAPDLEISCQAHLWGSDMSLPISQRAPAKNDKF